MKKKIEQSDFTSEPPKKVFRRRRSATPEVVVEASPMKPARKPAKTKDRKTSKPGPKRAVKAKVVKRAGRKPGLKKKVTEETTKAVASKAGKKPDRKPGPNPGRKPGVKTAVMVPAARGRKLTGREADLVKKGEEAFAFFLGQQLQMDEMAQVITNYERMFEAVRRLFSREMDEIEEMMAGLLE